LFGRRPLELVQSRVWSGRDFNKSTVGGRAQRRRIFWLGAVAGALTAIGVKLLLEVASARAELPAHEPAREPTRLRTQAAVHVQASSAPNPPAPIEPPPTKANATPLDDQAAATHLAEAYVWLTGGEPSDRGLAILWAHWAHETARGQRMQGHNFAGLKGSGPDGDSIMIWTREATSSDERLVQRTFRAYSDEASGARDYLSLLRERYPQALRAVRRGDVTGFVSALAQNGYFTDDPALYLRAITRLAAECRRRGIAERALSR